MLQSRAIPCLLLNENGLYKTIQFKNPVYVGDPINAVKIFNEKEVDELIILDITASKQNREPNYELLKHIASECFMPLAYGGGIKNFQQAAKLFELGIEKISLNLSAIENPNLITEITSVYGNQSVIVSIDIKKNLWGKYGIYSHNGTKNTRLLLNEFIKKVESLGAGELLITNIEKEGTWSGFDIDLLKSLTSLAKIPIIIGGGCGNIQHIADAVNTGKASAVAIGSMAVFQKKGMGVLISFPKSEAIEKLLNEYGV
ncbi:MAG: imidazole glycerol phosphate synthase subunit HisF [Bacteroidetes bacterium]|nr:imidazole glycerol phosphate synthase subunit HisF [Bacteroidota bacterium]